MSAWVSEWVRARGREISWDRETGKKSDLNRVKEIGWRSTEKERETVRHREREKKVKKKINDRTIFIIIFGRVVYAVFFAFWNRERNVFVTSNLKMSARFDRVTLRTLWLNCKRRYFKTRVTSVKIYNQFQMTKLQLTIKYKVRSIV